MEKDAELLSQFILDGSEAAFRALVEEHVRVVQATALRMLAGDAHAAQDVTQAVFTHLARNAAKLPQGVLLGGWLHQHTYFLAVNFVRAENRRRARERTAMEMQTTDAAANDAGWQKLAPVLDEALHRLDRDDRAAIVLRYLEQRDVRSVGATLRISENTAQKRIGRALDKLRVILTRQGVTLSTVTLATVLDGQTMPAVSAADAARVSAAAMSGAASATTGLTLASLAAMSTYKTLFALAVLALLAAIIIVQQNHGLKNVQTPASHGPVPPSTPPNSLPAATVASAAPATASVSAPAVDSAKTGPAASPPAPSIAVVPTPAPTTSGAQTGAAKGLQYVTVPFDGKKTMQDYVAKSAIAKSVIGTVDPSTVDVLPPLALYSMDMSVIDAGGGLESAHRMGGKYQFIVESSGQYVANALVMENDASAEGAVITFRNGNAGIGGAGTSIDGAATASALEQLAEMDQVTAGSYEVRILFLPYISTARDSTLLWLKSNGDDPDLFYIPANQVMPVPLQDEKLYTADEFFKLALPIMQQKEEEMRKIMPMKSGG
jgi:RNA polymerase sigma factor (sigma-70 family)